MADLDCYAGNTTMESLGLSSNIKVVQWAPQNDVLGHPAVKAFVTHAGSNGLYEAAYHGKPVVSVPIMNEQPAKAAKVVDVHICTGIALTPTCAVHIACQMHRC